MTIFKPGETAPLILIADDDPAIVRLLADRCSLMGFDVETASNETQALRRVRQGGKIWMLRWSRSTPQTRTASICRDRGRRAFPRRSRVLPVDDDLDGWLFHAPIRPRADWMTSWRPPVSLRSLKPSGGSHRKSSSSSFRTGSPEVQRAANDMIR